MLRLTLKLVCLSLVLSLTACAAAVVGGAARGGSSGDRAAQTDPAAVNDASITSAINASYVRDDLVSAFDVSVNTYRGTVTLYGRVASEQAARRAVDLARSVTGVGRVVSRLTVVAR
jgi:osmotically-inducible protein OsmY